MPKYRKRPVVIEAVQWFPGVVHPALEFSAPMGHFIETLEGRMKVRDGDWIITGVKGEHYPCKPDIFEATYEPVET